MGIPLGESRRARERYLLPRIPYIADSLTWPKVVPTRLSIRALARLGQLSQFAQLSLGLGLLTNQFQQREHWEQQKGVISSDFYTNLIKKINDCFEWVCENWWIYRFYLLFCYVTGCFTRGNLVLIFTLGRLLASTICKAKWGSAQLRQLRHVLEVWGPLLGTLKCARTGMLEWPN